MKSCFIKFIYKIIPNGKNSKFFNVSYLFPDYLMEVRLEKERGKKERKTLLIILQLALI